MNGPDPGLDLEEEVEAHMAAALEDAAAAAETLATPEDEDSLLARHARFRRGEELPYAWYRGGESVDEGVWAVDLDLFAEVWVSRHTWPALIRGTLPLQFGEDVLEVEVLVLLLRLRAYHLLKLWFQDRLPLTLTL